MKPKAIGAVVGLLLLLGILFYFFKILTAVEPPAPAHTTAMPEIALATPLPSALKPSVSDARAIISPAAPRQPLPVAGGPRAEITPVPTPKLVDDTLQTTITVITQWADTGAPAEGTSVTLRGVIGGKPIDGWTKTAATGPDGRVRLSFPEAFDWLVVTSLQPLAIRVNTAYERRTGDKVTTLDSLALLTDPLTVKLTRGSRVFGMVTRADTGQPVAGADVFGRSQSSGTMVNSKSDNNGIYLIDFLAPGPVVLEARGSGLFYDGKAAAPIVLKAGEQSGPHNIAMIPGAAISGAVTAREGGFPLAGALVVLSGDQRARPSATTGPDGRYTIDGIPPGTRQQATASYPGYATESSPVEAGTIGSTQVDFKLGPGGRIEATVHDDEQKPVEGAAVQIQDYTGRQGFAASVKTDAQGRAVLQNISVGQTQQTIIISKPGYRDTTSQERPAFDAQGLAKMDFTLNKIEKKQLNFFGTITDASHNPLAGIEVTAPSLGGGSASPAPASATTAADGTYKLGPIETESVQQIVLRAAGKGWGTAAKEAPAAEEPGQPVQVDFTLEPGHWIAGTVIDENKTPLAGIRVSISSSSLAYRYGSDDSRITTQADGKFRFESLSEQRISLNALPPGANLPVVQDAVVDQEIEITIKSAGVIRGRVTDARSKQPVPQFTVAVRGERIWSSSSNASQSFSDPDGRFVLENVDRNQPQRMTVDSPGYAQSIQQHIDAADGQSPAPSPELKIELTPANPLLISLIDKASGAPVAGAHLLAGVLPQNAYVNWDYLMRSSSNQMSNVQNLTTDANGAAMASEGNDPLTLLISAAGFSNTIVRPSDRLQFATGDKQLRIPLSKGGSISGTAFLDAKLAAGMQISMSSSDQSPGKTIVSLSSQCDGSGHYKFSALPAGQYRVSVTRISGNMGIQGITKKGQLAEGQDLTLDIGADMDVSALFGVVRRDGNPASGMMINLTPAFDWDYTGFGTFTDSNGEYKFLGLRPGSYRVSVQPSPIGASYSYRQPINETVTVAVQPTQRDFELQSGKKLSIHLVFPPGFPANVRTGIRSATLNIQRGPFGGIFNQPNTNQIDQNVQTDLAAGDRVVFNGRLQGSYSLSLMYLAPAPNGQAGSMIGKTFTVAPSLAIDNLQGDIDLGDIPVPMPPAQ